MKPVNFFPSFNTLKLESLNVDFHLHSTWTDGKNTVAQIISRAKECGLNPSAVCHACQPPRD